MTTLSSRQVEALGYATLKVSNLELSLTHLLWRLVNRDQRVGAAVTQDMDFRRILTLMDRLGSLHLQDPLRARLKKLVKDSHQLYNERNDLIHSAWGVDHSGSVVRLRLQKAFPPEAAVVAEEDLRRIGDCAGAIADEALKLLYDIIAAHGGYVTEIGKF